MLGLLRGVSGTAYSTHSTVQGCRLNPDKCTPLLCKLGRGAKVRDHLVKLNFLFRKKYERAIISSLDLGSKGPDGFLQCIGR